MTVSPRVELLFHPTDLNPQDLARAGQFLGSPASAIEAGLGALRLMMIDQMKAELAHTTGDVTMSKLVNIADLAWQAVFWKFRRVSAPVIADAYIRAYRNADAGDVPMSVIYDLADRHADRLGEYFHASSKQALGEGFNSFVNRKIATRVAADRVFDAYGLTPRQMGGYVAASDGLTARVNSKEQRSLKGKVLDYVSRSFRTRMKKFSLQEEHNIDQQAQQLAWMWLVNKNRLSAEAEKVWITARDEKVCPVCGPLHGQRVGVNEQFHTEQGDFWTPGVHPNCRCHVRLLEHTFKIGKADWWREEQHPRNAEGEFTTKKKKVTTLERTSPSDAEWLRQMRALAQQDVEAGEKVETEAKPLLSAPALSGAKLSGRAMLSAPAPVQAEAPVATTPLLRGPMVGVRPQLSTETQLVGNVELTTAPVTTESLLEASPQLTTTTLLTNATAMNQAVKAVTQPTTRTQTSIPVRNTMAIPGDASKGENLLYYYDPYGGAYSHGNKVQFNEGETWLKGEEGRVAIFAQIQKDTAHDIQDVVDQVLNADIEQRIGPKYVGPQGEEYVVLKTKDGFAFEISRENLERIITDTAYKQKPEPLENVYMWDADDPKESYGRSYETMPAKVVTDALYITPENFEKTVYVTDHAHDEQATETEAGTRYGFATWANTGQFNITDASTGAANQGVAKLTNIEPDVDIERF